MIQCERRFNDLKNKKLKVVIKKYGEEPGDQQKNYMTTTSP